MHSGSRLHGGLTALGTGRSRNTRTDCTSSKAHTPHMSEANLFWENVRATSVHIFSVSRIKNAEQSKFMTRRERPSSKRISLEGMR
eukprot:5057636-Amphidinium_carterae.1